MRHIVCAALSVVLLFTMSVPASLLIKPSFAQDEAIVIAGATYTESLMNSIITGYQRSSDDDTEFQIEAAGPTAGFSRLCDGSADLVMSTREISDEELLNCTNATVEIVEFVIGLDGLVLVANQEGSVACVPDTSLTTIFLRDSALTWNDLSTEGTTEEISLYGPPSEDRLYGLLEALLDNNVPRVTYEAFESPEAALELVQDPANNALVFMSFAQWQTITDAGNAQLISFRSPQDPECTAPTTGTLSTGDYQASRFLLLYANASSLSKEPVKNMLAYTFGDAAAPIENRPLVNIIANEGFTTPVLAVLDRNLNNLNGPIVGRTFTRTDAPSIVNTAIVGEITVGGSGLASYATRTVYDSFSALYTTATLNVLTLGNDQGWQAFCTGETAVIQVSRPANETEIALCAENEITPHSVYLGSEAVVFLVNSNFASLFSETPMCLDYTQLATMLVRSLPEQPATEEGETEDPSESTEENTSSENDETSYHPNVGIVLVQDGETPVPSETPEGDDDTSEENTTDETPTEEPTSEDTDPIEEPTPLDPAKLQGPARWNEIDPNWPDLPLLILVPALGASETDIVLSRMSSMPTLRRTDSPIVQETPSDAHLEDVDYRIGGLVNFDGAITYVYWSDYQASQFASDNVQLVAINSGNGCIVPSEESITDGTYSFAFSSWLVFSEKSLADPVVASLLWQTYSNETLTAVEGLETIGFDRERLEATRADIFTLIEAAQPQATIAPTEPRTRIVG